MLLQDFERDPGAGFGIGQSVVMVRQVETAGGRDGVQLMIGQLRAERPPRSPAGTVEPIAGIRHAVKFEDGAQAPFVEGRIVGHKI